jgi:hypothetical protein
MARPTSTSVRTPEYAPQQQGATTRLGVYAPLNVQTGPSSAEQFALALGLVNRTIAPAIAQSVHDKAQDQTAEGMAAAMADTVDPKRLAEDEYYARGQKRVLADRAVLDAINEFQTGLDKGEIDRSSAAVLHSQFNKFMGDKLGNFLHDPEAAQWALDKLAPYQQKVFGDLQKEQADAFKLDAISTVADSLRLAVKSGKPADFEAEKQKLVAANFSKGEATAILMKELGQTAIELRDPTILEQVPDRWPDGTPGPKSIPEVYKQLNEDAYYARVARDSRDRELKAASEKAADADVSEATIAAYSGNIGKARTILDPLLRSGAIERAEYQSIMGFGRSSIDFYRGESVSPGAIAEFRARLAEGKFATQREALAYARDLLPPGEQGARTMSQLADDVTSRFNADEHDKDPLAKPYRANLDTRAKPVVPTPRSNERYAAVMLEYDRTLVRTGSAEKAKEAAEKVLKATEATAPGKSRVVGNAVVTEMPNP